MVGTGRWFFSLLFCGFGVLLLAWVGFAAGAERSRKTDLEKIAPWVLNQTRDGGEAEFLVVLADQADLSGARALTGKGERGRHARDVLWRKAETTQGAILQWLRARGIEHRPYYIVNAIWVKGSAEIAAALAARADVARIEGNPQIRNLNLPVPEEQFQAEPQAPAAIEGGISYSRAPEVWTLGYTGQGIVIGGADTGYRWDHNALKAKYRGWNGLIADHNYNWHDSIHSGGGLCGPNSAAPCDDNGHGTHTIGTAVGADSSGTNQIGMAPDAKWIGCRNMDQGNGTPARYLECMEFFLAPYPIGGTPAQGDPNRAPDVTVNSWSCPPIEGCSAGTLQMAAAAQRAAGIMTVASANNEGPNCSTIQDPLGIYEDAYTVGALTNGTDTIATFSSRGPVTVDGSFRRKPDIVAPGTSVRSASAASTSAYTTFSGTSMAVPHVAGAVALLWSAQPELRNDITQTRKLLDDSALGILSTTCDEGSIAVTPNNTYGHGRLDAKHAVAGALLEVLAVERQNADIIVTFQAVAGAKYRLQRRDGLTSGTWATVAGVSDITAATTQAIQFTHPGGGSDPTAYYRVVLVR